MSKVSEYEVNVKIAEILRKYLGIDARAERIIHRKRPDIIYYYRGLIIGIEASKDKGDAERDAMRRLEEGRVDIAIALRIPKGIEDVPEDELEEVIKRSRFDAKVITREVLETLIPYIEMRTFRKHEEGWFNDIDIAMLKNIIDAAIEALTKEEEVRSYMKSIKDVIGEFARGLASIDNVGEIRAKIYDILYKLYGLEVAEARDPEVAFGHTALSILLSAVFYEYMRNFYPQLESLSKYVERFGPIDGVRRALEDLLKIDYRTAIEVAKEILEVLPPGATERVRNIVTLATKISQKRALFRRDFVGRIYHEITGDIALRKGFATFYTEVPAAYLLATLATHALLGLDKKDLLELGKDEAHKMIERIRSIKVGDFACGSGTLLTATYYSLVHRIAARIRTFYEEKVDLNELGEDLLNNIYGMDALRYASQITAVNLALIGPEKISGKYRERGHIYTVYLGYIPQGPWRGPWLGSLELLSNARRIGGILAWIEGGHAVAKRVTLEGMEGPLSIPTKFDMIIMNPPFTRPTYRGKLKEEEEKEKKAFFGFITSKEIREELKEKYSKLLDHIAEDLRSIAISNIDKLRDAPDEVKIIIRGGVDEKLSQYLKIGLAGEALPFLYLAYKYVDDGSVIAFVLPRALLTGVNWFLARVLLATKFHLRYIIVSSDPERGYNFSEGTSLSETLIVAKRSDRHLDDEETTFIILTRKPRTMLESIMLAERIMDAERRGYTTASLGRDGAECIIRRVRRNEIIRHIDNWGRLTAIADDALTKYVLSMLESGRIVLPLEGAKISLEIPLARLGTMLRTEYVARRRGRKVTREPIKCIGIDSHQFYELFTSVSQSPYPVRYGTGEELGKTMKISPNAYVVPKNRNVEAKAIEMFNVYAGRILIPQARFRLNTSHAVAFWSESRMLSNAYYALRLNVKDELEEAEKALVLWLNTTWGLLSMLINREETEGAWIQIKMGQWMLLPVLNINALDANTLRRLSDVFDRYSNKPLRRIPDQFDPKGPDEVRLGIDIGFIKALKPDVSENDVRRYLLELYRHVYVALRQWIGE